MPTKFIIDNSEETVRKETARLREKTERDHASAMANSFSEGFKEGFEEGFEEVNKELVERLKAAGLYEKFMSNLIDEKLKNRREKCPKSK